MEYVALVAAAIKLVNSLMERGRQTGELTDAQAAKLQQAALVIFAQYANPAPRPLAKKRARRKKKC